MIEIIATTELTSKAFKKHPYAIRFTINPKTGEIRFIEEKHSDMKLKSYMLLHMLNKLVREINPDLLKEGELKAEWTWEKANKNSQKRYPCLRVGDKVYRLDETVEAEWINEPKILPMLRYITELETWDPSACFMAFKCQADGYKLLNPAYAPKWKCFVQEVED